MLGEEVSKNTLIHFNPPRLDHFLYCAIFRDFFIRKIAIIDIGELFHI